MEFLPKKGKTDDYGVTGVSRSGRVRKKSSKLMDFESPDEIEKPPKRQTMLLTTAVVQHHRRSDFSPKKSHGEDDVLRPEYDYDDVVSQESASDYEPEPFQELQLPSNESMDDSQSDMEEEPALPATVATAAVVAHAGFRRIDELPTQTVYASATDKTPKKRLVIKDGKVMTGKTKTPKKEKGKAKKTAYMLWSNEQRAKILAETPKLDFASISKRLSELWACVSTGEKDAWQRRAKRINSKLQPLQEAAAAAESGGGGGRAGKRFISNPAATASMQSHHHHHHHQQQQQRGGSTAVKFGGGAAHLQVAAAAATTTTTGTSPEGGMRGRDIAKPGIRPIDVAAHLKLLGESLTLIGERLKEHEGQIAVSGSLSVLLDSLLCALGPLLCLTQQVPELRERCVTPDQLTCIVDNVAYIMPGL